MNEHEKWDRLGRLVEARRKHLGLTQEEVASNGGPSTATQRIIEAGRQTSYRGSTLRDLELALDWRAGSVQAILDGGEPTPGAAELPALAPASGPARPVGLAGYGTDLSPMSDDELVEHWALFNFEALRTVREYARRHRMLPAETPYVLHLLLGGELERARQTQEKAQRLWATLNKESDEHEQRAAANTPVGSAPTDPFTTATAEASALPPRPESTPSSQPGAAARRTGQP